MQALMLEQGANLQVALFFGFLLVFLLAEQIVPRRRPVRVQRKRWLTNSLLTILAILVLPILPVTFITVGFWAAEREIGLMNNLPLDLPVWAIALATLLLRGFISFFSHWLNHRVPWLWRLHRVHHMDTELDVSSTVRFHPLEMPITMLVGLPLIILMGLSPWALLFYELFDACVVVFSHSNVKIPCKVNRVLRYVIVTPDLHKIHHSAYQPETDSNFGAVFPIWDIVFRTFRTESTQPIETMQLGLQEVDTEHADNLIWLLASPFLSLKTLQPSTQNNGTQQQRSNIEQTIGVTHE